LFKIYSGTQGCKPVHFHAFSMFSNDKELPQAG
jgi:hypothetical protein